MPLYIVITTKEDLENVNLKISVIFCVLEKVINHPNKYCQLLQIIWIRVAGKQFGYVTLIISHLTLFYFDVICSFNTANIMSHNAYANVGSSNNNVVIRHPKLETIEVIDALNYFQKTCTIVTRSFMSLWTLKSWTASDEYMSFWRNLDKVISASRDHFDFEVRFLYSLCKLNRILLIFHHWLLFKSLAYFTDQVSPFLHQSSAPKEAVNKRDFCRQNFGAWSEHIITRMTDAEFLFLF